MQQSLSFLLCSVCAFDPLIDPVFWFLPVQTTILSFFFSSSNYFSLSWSSLFFFFFENRYPQQK